MPRGPVSGVPAAIVGSQSKTTALSSGPMSDLGAGDRAELEQPVLDAEAGEPVGEVADGLVVGEVGLAHPALRALAAHAEADAVAVLLAHDGEAGVVDGPRA